MGHGYVPEEPECDRRGGMPKGGFSLVHTPEDQLEGVDPFGATGPEMQRRGYVGTPHLKSRVTVTAKPETILTPSRPTLAERIHHFFWVGTT